MVRKVGSRKKAGSFIAPPGYVFIEKRVIDDMVVKLEGGVAVLEDAAEHCVLLMSYLRKYADHIGDCPATDEFPGKCVCGWTTVRRKLKL